MENMANRVVRKVPCAIMVSSLPYFKQKIVPNEATGIAMMIVLMAMEVGSMLMPGICPMSWKMPHTTKGRMTSRNGVIRKTFGPPVMCFKGICEML